MVVCRILIVVMVMAGTNVVTAESAELQDIVYRGIRPTDPGGRNGLRNPERGFRLETLIAEPVGEPEWGPASHLRGRVTSGYSDDWWVLDARRYAAEGLTLAQTYCYLDRFAEGRISNNKLDRLQRSLDRLRAVGLNTSAGC